MSGSEVKGLSSITQLCGFQNASSNACTEIFGRFSMHIRRGVPGKRLWRSLLAVRTFQSSMGHIVPREHHSPHWVTSDSTRQIAESVVMT
jgi:hypothetical protein